MPLVILPVLDASHAFDRVPGKQAMETLTIAVSRLGKRLWETRGPDSD